MILLFYFIYAILAILFITTLINAIAGPRLRNAPSQSKSPPVSILVPARNEERHIEKCIRSLQKQDYKNVEIIIIDDESSDNTYDIVRGISEKDPRVSIYRGRALPEGWTGKNWACHQLSQLAGGEIIIFTDADNRHETNAVRKTVAWVEKYHLDLISAFPQQETRTLFEKLIIPVVDLFLYSFLPLWLTYYLPQPSLAAANGQWIAFRKKSYDKIGGHSQVKAQIVEDVELSRLAKKKQLRILTCSGTGIIYGHMYQSYREVWQGFTKNLYGLVSHNVILFILMQIILMTLFILPYIMLWLPQFSYMSLLAIVIGLSIRLVLVLGFKHPPLVSLLFHPISIVLTSIIGFNSFTQITFGQVLWKSREIRINKSTNKK